MTFIPTAVAFVLRRCRRSCRGPAHLLSQPVRGLLCPRARLRARRLVVSRRRPVPSASARSFVHTPPRSRQGVTQVQLCDAWLRCLNQSVADGPTVTALRTAASSAFVRCTALAGGRRFHSMHMSCSPTLHNRPDRVAATRLLSGAIEQHDARRRGSLPAVWPLSRSLSASVRLFASATPDRSAAHNDTHAAKASRKHSTYTRARALQCNTHSSGLATCCR